MIIRKKFKAENAHVVRDCTSKACSQNYHGHSYTYEVILHGRTLDNGGMIMDFGLFKRYFKDIFESFDHAMLLSINENKETLDFFSMNNARLVITPFNTSAEEQSVYFFHVLDDILKRLQFNNGENGVTLQAVRVHETLTGYAESSREDIEDNNRWDWKDVIYSEALISEWYDKDMLTNKPLSLPELPEQFYNPTPVDFKNYNG